MEAATALIGPVVERYLPPAALLSTLSGIAVSLIAARMLLKKIDRTVQTQMELKNRHRKYYIAVL
jgi:uncharacterized membrane-anchored protein YhcB (DUF1043 family)